MEALWVFPSAEDAAGARLAASLGVPRRIGEILWRRGFRSREQSLAYLEAGLDQLHDPHLLLGMAAAVARIQAAISNREKILLYGDYDVDGTSSIVILKSTLDLLGAECDYFVPHRILDGYGMKSERIEQAARDGVRLIISADTGIRAGEVVALASRLGMDTIVTDHHLPEEAIPPAVAVLNPNQPGCEYPNRNLCGAGVAFQLASALVTASGWPGEKQERMRNSLLKMAALATVADIVPLVAENRAIVKQGLAGLAATKNPGLRALMTVAGIKPGVAPTARQVGFQIGPRINAAGRMASAREVIELFLSAKPAEAERIAQTLDERNRERQDTERAMIEGILAQVAGDARMGLVLFDATWHLGVAGIVAGRIAERERKPVVVLAEDEKTGGQLVKGSGRSLGGYHLLEALESMRDLFEQFGGHEQAAGVTLRRERVEEFSQRFAQVAAERLTPEMRRPRLEIDSLVEAGDVNAALYEALQRFEPFGYRNPAPLLAMRDAEIAAPPVVLKGKHLKLSVRQNGRMLTLKAWGMAEDWASLAAGDRIDIAFRLEADSWDGWAAVVAGLRRSREAIE
ncbi:MAG: single-stranded-DNA-specific exonuclease RecJ [Bryobacter sp.]|nr:single-stranded-DNA-specific exonuclease RecJ [Bryobacter sp.]